MLSVQTRIAQRGFSLSGKSIPPGTKNGVQRSSASLTPLPHVITKSQGLRAWEKAEPEYQNVLANYHEKAAKVAMADRV
jgi:hypothetical protein